MSTIQRADHLTPDQVTQVLAVAQEAYAADGVYPLNESAALRLRGVAGNPPTRHLLADDATGLAGYAQLDLTDPAAGVSAELVVRPRSRRQGLGRSLLAAAIAAAQESGGTELRLWAHGDHPGAGALAGSIGFTRVRALWRMGRSLDAAIPSPDLPDGVELRSFQSGADDAAWLALNARAFADHPEQGRWTAQDLRARQAESWFDPAGFLLAERNGELLGFHWTKVHPASGDPPTGPVGEVYVLGVDPTAHGLGLGTALTLAGLRHLRDRGLTEAMLYVEESNPAATALYAKLGFTRSSVDVAYARAA